MSHFRKSTQTARELKERAEKLLKKVVLLNDGRYGYLYTLQLGGGMPRYRRYLCHICQKICSGHQELLDHSTNPIHASNLLIGKFSPELFSEIRLTKPLDAFEGDTPPEEADLPSTDTKIVPGEPVPPGMEGIVEQQCQIQESIDAYTAGPLIGLEYIVELVRGDKPEPKYICLLCEKKGDPRSVLIHMTSFNHYLKYICCFFRSVGNKLNMMPKTISRKALNTAVLKVAMAIEKHHGRLKPTSASLETFSAKKYEILREIDERDHFRETPETTFLELVTAQKMKDYEQEPMIKEPPVSLLKVEEEIKANQLKQEKILARNMERARNREANDDNPSTQDLGGVMNQEDDDSAPKKLSIALKKPERAIPGLKSTEVQNPDMSQLGTLPPLVVDENSKDGVKSQHQSENNDKKDDDDDVIILADDSGNANEGNSLLSVSDSSMASDSKSLNRSRKSSRDRSRARSRDPFGRDNFARRIRSPDRSSRDRDRYDRGRYRRNDRRDRSSDRSDRRDRSRDLDDRDRFNQRSDLRDRDRGRDLRDEILDRRNRSLSRERHNERPRDDRSRGDRPLSPYRRGTSRDRALSPRSDRNRDRPLSPRSDRNRDRPLSPRSDRNRLDDPDRRNFDSYRNDRFRNDDLSSAGDRNRYRSANDPPDSRYRDGDRDRQDPSDAWYRDGYRDIDWDRRDPVDSRYSDRGRRDLDSRSRDLDRDRQDYGRDSRLLPYDRYNRSPDRDYDRKSSRNYELSERLCMIENNRDKKAKWEAYNKEVAQIEKEVMDAYAGYQERPEKHPSYPDEWKTFWNRRYKEIQLTGQDPNTYDYKPEWILFWQKKMQELQDTELTIRKDEAKRKHKLDADEEIHLRHSDLQDVSPPTPEHAKDVTVQDIKKTWKELTGSEITTAEPDRKSPWEEDQGNRGTKRSLSPHDDHPRSIPPWERSASRRTPPREQTSSFYDDSRDNRSDSRSNGLFRGPVPPVVHCLRMLSVIEEQLGMQVPKVLELLTQALALEKKRPSGSMMLLENKDVFLFFETTMERLKAQIMAGVVKKSLFTTTRCLVKAIKRMLDSNPLKPEVFEPVTIPGVGAVDKMAVAQKIAASLISLGHTNVSQEELEQLISAVVGMANSGNISADTSTDKFFSQLNIKNSTASSGINNILNKMITTAQLSVGLPSAIPGMVSVPATVSVPTTVSVPAVAPVPEQAPTVAPIKIVEKKKEVTEPIIPGLGTDDETRAPSPFSLRKDTGANPIGPDMNKRPNITSYNIDDEEDEEDDYSFEDVFKAAAQKAKQTELEMKKVDPPEAINSQTQSSLSSVPPESFKAVNDLFKSLSGINAAPPVVEPPQEDKTNQMLANIASLSQPLTLPEEPSATVSFNPSSNLVAAIKNSLVESLTKESAISSSVPSTDSFNVPPRTEAKDAGKALDPRYRMMWDPSLQNKEEWNQHSGASYRKEDDKRLEEQQRWGGADYDSRDRDTWNRAHSEFPYPHSSYGPDKSSYYHPEELNYRDDYRAKYEQSSQRAAPPPVDRHPLERESDPYYSDLREREYGMGRQHGFYGRQGSGPPQGYRPTPPVGPGAPRGMRPMPRPWAPPPQPRNFF